MCSSRPSGPPPHLAVSCCSRCWPAAPLAVSGRLSAPWPGVSPPQSPHRAGPGAPQGLGASSTPGAPPCVPPGGVGWPLLGWDALRLRGSLGFASPCPRGPRLSAPASPSGSAFPHGRLRMWPRGPVLFSVVPPWALFLHAPAPYPGSSSAGDGPPASVTGGSGAGRAPSGLLAVGVWGDHLGCSVCVVCHVGRVVFGCSLGRSSGLLNPTLTSAALPLARAQGCVCPCVLMHVSCARLSPRGLTCVSGCVHGCVCR